MSEVTALYADEDGNILDIPGLGAMGRIGSQEVPLKPENLIPLPPGSDLMFMPGRQAVGYSSDGEILHQYRTADPRQWHPRTRSVF